MAEGIFRALAEDKGLNVEVDSCGTGGWHSGEAPDKRAIAVMHNHGMDISQLRARKFTGKDFEDFDIIMAMDRQNLRDLKRLARDENQLKKLTLAIKNEDVPDPYYGNEADFRKVYDLLKTALAEHIDNLPR
ncbi:MAG: hypothetical protein RL226_603 [Bacteroidota bacterium]|jgi:protein-tyrosine phosphatase